MQPGEVIGPGGDAPKQDEKPVDQPAAPVSVPTETIREEAQIVKPDSNWQFNSEHQPVNPSKPASHEAVSWTASEYIAHEKGGSWYLLLGVVIIIASALVYLITQEITSTVVIAIMGIAFGAFAARKPQELEYVLDYTGLKVGTKMYPYSQFKSFTIVEEGAIDSIMLMPLQRFMPPLSVYFDPSDEEKITNALSTYLPYEDRKQDAVDRLMRKVRF